MFGLGAFPKLFNKTDGKVESDKKDKKLLQKETIFALDNDDGASIVEMGGNNDVVMIGSEFVDQRTKIEEYRSVARIPEVSRAVEEITNDAVSCDEVEDVVNILLDDCEDISDQTKELIRDEFQHILRLLNFNDKSFHIFKRWFTDGRIFAQTIINEGRLSNGIQKIVFLDPRCTRLVEKRRYETDQTGVERIVERERVFMYNPSALTNDGRTERRIKMSQGVELPEDVVSYAHASEYDEHGRMVGHLEDVLKPANDLRNMEDSVVIYRIVNAPERRVYYIDTGNLPKKSAEELVRRVRSKFRNKVVYDSRSGKVKSETKHMAMTDSIWLPRREGNNATEVDTLQGGQNLGEIDDVTYFLKKLQLSTKVPLGRLNEDSSINIGGNDDEMTREELKFSLYVSRLRREFNPLLKGLLKRQLILKRITTKRDWDMLIEPFVKFDYTAESAAKQRHDAQTMLDRYGNLDAVEPYVGSLISRKTVQTQILRMTEDDILAEEKQIKAERDAGLYPEPDEDSFGESTGLRPSGSGSLKLLK